MKTITPSSKDLKKQWLLIDAADVTLGKVATNAAHYLKGKHKTNYTPHTDDGDYVVVINAEKVKLTGNKLDDKMYHRHTGYVGHVKSVNYRELMDKKPEFVIEKAVKGMLPKNRLGRVQYGNLKVYAGAEHKHEAQKPEKIALR